MTFQKFLFWVHLVAGLLAGGVILSMAVSGILMAYEPQLVEWAEKDRRIVAVPAPGAERLSLDSLSALAAASAPGKRFSGLTVQSDPAASVSVAFGRDGGNVYVNPYTGAVLGGDSRMHGFLHAVEEWHRWFGVREIGKRITGAAVLLFSLLLISGLYLWFPRRLTRAAFRTSAVPKFNLKGRARDWNWHNTVGFWAAPLILVTTLTGTVIAYRWASDILFVLTGNEPPPRPPEATQGGQGGKGVKAGQAMQGGAKPERRVAEAGSPGAASASANGPEASAERPRKEGPVRANLDAFLSRADALAPGWAAVSFRLPQKPGGPVTASIVMTGASKYARSQLSLDAATAEAVKWEPYAEQNLGRRLRGWIVPVHTGRAGGPVGQFFALLSASAALLLVWTGVAMAWRRFTKRSGA